jgi:hypothetical protein
MIRAKHRGNQDKIDAKMRIIKELRKTREKMGLKKV